MHHPLTGRGTYVSLLDWDRHPLMAAGPNVRLEEDEGRGKEESSRQSLGTAVYTILGILALVVCCVGLPFLLIAAGGLGFLSVITGLRGTLLFGSAIIVVAVLLVAVAGITVRRRRRRTMTRKTSDNGGDACCE